MSESPRHTPSWEEARSLVAERAPVLLVEFDTALRCSQKIKASRILQLALDAGAGKKD